MAASIDALLERYLRALDRYTKLQQQLGQAQKTTFQQLARANWTAPRGVRYGCDFYDQRMKAMRRVEAGVETEAGVRVRVTLAANETAGAEEEDTAKADDAPGAQAEPTAPDQPPSQQATLDPRNPIRWFGVLAPPAIKMAQSEAIGTVENLIPQLINARCDLRQLEIDIGRARKQQARNLARPGPPETGPAAAAAAAATAEVAEVADALHSVSLVASAAR
ncbi:hypothetical protein BROUX41_003789 [Berkeleyomyces rouxiae]|uniref:uncharacterized protein n=1 Tax=Berkeleyomyces rouxiae TaxID=2035830 RepID=UPI003B807816